MTFKFSHAILGIFCLTVCILSFLTLTNYPGHAVVYIFFTIVLNALCILGFTKKKIFFDTFIGIFFWLGYWLKFSVRVAFMGGKFHEPVGNFDGTGTAFDRALIVTTCGVAALLIASLIRRKFFFSYTNAAEQSRHESTFTFYRRYRKLILIVIFVLFALVGITNVIFGIYQRGSIPRTFLPFGLNGVYTWLLLFGMASVSSVILDCEFRLKSNPYLVSVMILLESFVSNVSMLSRGMVLNTSAMIIGFIDNAKKRFIDLSIGYLLIVFAVFVVLFVSSVFAVNYIRCYTIISSVDDAAVRRSKELRSEALRSGISGSKKLDSPELNVEPINPSDIKSKAVRSSVHASKSLFLDRWVGIEGAMAVSSYPSLGWDLWKRAWQEQFSNYGTSMYDLTFIRSPYLESDMLKHHYLSVPGILAFFYYPGSYPFLFISMFFVGLIAAGIEFYVYRLSGANLILCALLAQVVASRYAHFGYAPNQSYLLFGSVFLNVLMIYVLNKSLFYLNKKARS